MQEDKTGAAANPFRESFFVERKLCRCGAFSHPVLSNDLGVLTAPVGICNSAIDDTNNFKRLSDSSVPNKNEICKKQK